MEYRSSSSEIFQGTHVEAANRVHSECRATIEGDISIRDKEENAFTVGIMPVRRSIKIGCMFQFPFKLSHFRDNKYPYVILNFLMDLHPEMFELPVLLKYPWPGLVVSSGPVIELGLITNGVK